jgi:hypothetical protein
MKTIQDLFAISGEAVMNNCDYKHWFFDYAGHVNKLRIRLYSHGWESGIDPSHSLEANLDNDESIQAAYWFIKSNL